ncbi:MAG TPA: efflux RND transporter permease subunit [Steroidobacteraceae bacterium]|nr:efflux RND transporter permease subunit [Steroidobacteraceae bacterium]
MNLVHFALRRPYTVLVLVLGVVLGAVLGLREMPRDVFPPLGVPTIYVAQPYGGMSPAQMEGFLTYYYEYHFLYITGIEHVESKSIEGAALIKLQFHPGTDMSQAMSETVQYVSRARAFMPPGTVPPFVMRFDAGSVPVGDLVFSSATRSVGQIQDLALNTVRPLFATLPGVSAPPPFGGSARAIVVSLDPAKLQAYRIAPQDVVTAIANAETISPSGNIYSNDKYPVVEVNSIVKGAEELADVPVRPGTLPAVFVRDVARVADGSDILTSVALVNGRPTVYIPVTKRADASTLSVVNIVRQNLPRFQAALPDDVKVSYVFDQSSFVTRAIGGLTTEGILGAILAGLMVLLFLRDWRSALIVVINIPLSLLAATCALWVTGETINIMTLGGLVLAVGILVDESTVVIENIHTHFVTRGEAGLERNVLDAGLEVLGPRLIAMLCVLAVFLPSFAMQGSARALFVPLSLAVGFSLAASYFLGSMLVPILSIWVFRAKHAAGHFAADPGTFDRLRQRYAGAVRRLVSLNWLVLGGYLAACAILIAILAPRLGTDIFPRVEAGQLQVRLRMPAGTRLEVTTAATQRALHLIADAAKPSSIAASVGLVGVHAPSYPINFIYQWNSGPQESVLQVQFTDAKPVDLAALRERLRKRFAKEMPAAEISFEPSDIVSRVMSFGASTPIEVQVSGANLADDRAFATRVRTALARLPMLRDVQFGQPLEYPAVDVTVNRQRAGVLGVTTNDVTQSLSAATASSRFTQPVYWAASSGVAYQVQVEVPQHDLTSLEDLRNVPVTTDDGHSMLLRNIATVHPASIVGEYDRYNMARMVTVTANIEGASLGEAAAAVNDELAKLGGPPKRVSLAMRGEVAPMTELLSALRTGLALAVLVIFLLLVANFQSWQLAVVAIGGIPAAIAGVLLLLFLTGSTLNLESFMGAIMAVGVAIANAILLTTFAERERMRGETAAAAVARGATGRLRPILMTSLAMIAGMLPMAIGFGESGQQTAPLGRAVIGGLALATLATLFVLPSLFAVLRGRTGRRPASLHPEDVLAHPQEPSR